MEYLVFQLDNLEGLRIKAYFIWYYNGRRSISQTDNPIFI